MGCSLPCGCEPWWKCNHVQPQEPQEADELVEYKVMLERARDFIGGVHRDYTEAEIQILEEIDLFLATH